jgi:hypothetical protein
MTLPEVSAASKVPVRAALRVIYWLMKYDFAE